MQQRINLTHAAPVAIETARAPAHMSLHISRAAVGLCSVCVCVCVIQVVSFSCGCCIHAVTDVALFRRTMQFQFDTVCCRSWLHKLVLGLRDLRGYLKPTHVIQSLGNSL